MAEAKKKRETPFSKVLTAPAERLVNILYKTVIKEEEPRGTKLARIAKRLAMNSEQLTCALGFNAALRELTDVVQTLGFSSYDQLAKQRNEIFVSDMYRYLTIDDILCIYVNVAKDTATQAIMQYLLKTRLENIEKRIEATVNSLIIERYKKEMRSIYNDGLAQIEFAEARLDKTDSGFRALVNEVAIIVEARIIPVGDIFFRETILPEEKRKIMTRGLIPEEFITTRLEDKQISEQERKMLEDYVRLNLSN